MNFSIKRVEPSHYPYNYRIECFGGVNDFMPAMEWTEELHIPCCWNGHILYIAEKYVSMFILRWSR